VAFRRSSSALRACRSFTSGGVTVRRSGGRLVHARSVCASVSSWLSSEVRVIWACAIHSARGSTPGGSGAAACGGAIGSDAVKT
jgi:hypothetical protein